MGQGRGGSEGGGRSQGWIQGGQGWIQGRIGVDPEWGRSGSRVGQGWI